MNRRVILLGLTVLLAASGPGCGQGGANHFDIQSKAVGATYTIEVVMPAGAATSGSKHPAVYCTDWFVLSDYMKSLPKLMNMGRMTEPFVFVGISRQADWNEWSTTRTRDYTPARVTDEYSKEHLQASALELTGGAPRFVSFLKEELIPLVESSYPVDPSRRGFVGYSLGSLLGVHVLVNEPQLFHYYLLGSPSMWFNEYGLALEFEKEPAKNLDSVKKVYLSVGEDESWEMLKGYGMLRDAFLEKGFREPRAKMEIIEDAGHVGAMPIALYNGIRFLFSTK